MPRPNRGPASPSHQSQRRHAADGPAAGASSVCGLVGPASPYGIHRVIPRGAENRDSRPARSKVRTVVFPFRRLPDRSGIIVRRQDGRLLVGRNIDGGRLIDGGRNRWRHPGRRIVDRRFGSLEFHAGASRRTVTLIQTAFVPVNSVTAISPWEMPRDEIHLENREEVFFSGVVLIELFHEICALRCQKNHQAAHLQAHFVLRHAHHLQRCRKDQEI